MWISDSESLQLSILQWQEYFTNPKNFAPGHLQLSLAQSLEGSCRKWLCSVNIAIYVLYTYYIHTSQCGNYVQSPQCVQIWEFFSLESSSPFALLWHTMAAFVASAPTSLHSHLQSASPQAGRSSRVIIGSGRHHISWESLHHQFTCYIYYI